MASPSHPIPLIVLVHSPLVGPFTWSLVAPALHTRGREVLIPPLAEQEGDARPYWQQHAQAVVQALVAVPRERALHLVAHSGAGPLLPAIRQALPHPVTSYLFVDAGLPRNGASRLDLIAEEAPEWVAGLRVLLAAGGAFPSWKDEDLSALVPNKSWRQSLLAGLQPRGWAFFEEPLPVFAGWPDAPCSYLQFSPAYDWSARQAERRGWPVKRHRAGHFHMLVDPEGVAALIVDLLGSYER